MELIRGIQALTRPLDRAVVTIGNFDGVHCGHRHIIGLALERARAIGGVAVGYTFKPHPQVALKPGNDLPLLLTYDERAELLAETGLELLVEEPFSREFSTTPPEAFFQDALLRRLNAQAIIVGYDFAFGRERQGSLERLGDLCRQSGIELVVVDPQRSGSEVVSSSRIRSHLLAGQIEPASRLLGREFFYRGIVQKGEGRGRKIGFPTANLALENKLKLPYGVYATWAERRDTGEVFQSVTNVGVRPTFDDVSQLPALIETHLLAPRSEPIPWIDLYGTTLEVRFIKRIREERKFSGIDALQSQIALDCEQARQILPALT